MSYSLYPYLVSIDRLGQLVGSRDRELLGAIRQRSPQAWQPSESAPLTVGQATEQLVMGNRSEKEATWQYGYALELLCQQIGTPIESDVYQSLHLGVLEEIGVVSALVDSGPPVPLPRIPDFPAIGHLRWSQAQEILNKWPVDSANREEHFIQEARDEFHDWLELAAERQLDLVAFYY